MNSELKNHIELVEHIVNKAVKELKEEIFSSKEVVIFKKGTHPTLPIPSKDSKDFYIDGGNNGTTFELRPLSVERLDLESLTSERLYRFKITADDLVEEYSILNAGIRLQVRAVLEHLYGTLNPMNTDRCLLFGSELCTCTLPGSGPQILRESMTPPLTWEYRLYSNMGSYKY